jgi:hypothetical protein
MSFVSNVDHLTLGEGVYNNVHGDLNNIHVVQNIFYTGRKGNREKRVGGGSLLLQESFLVPSRKRRRRREESDHEIRVRKTPTIT